MKHDRAMSQLWLRLGAVWLALVALLAATVVSAYLPIGPLHSPVNLVIAALKVLLVALFFMHLKRSDALIRLAAIAGLFWLTFLFALTFSDYLSRS